MATLLSSAQTKQRILEKRDRKAFAMYRYDQHYSSFFHLTPTTTIDKYRGEALLGGVS